MNSLIELDILYNWAAKTISVIWSQLFFIWVFLPPFNCPIEIGFSLLNTISSSSEAFLWSHHLHKCMWWRHRREPSLLLLPDFGTPSHRRPYWPHLCCPSENRQRPFSSGKLSLNDYQHEWMATWLATWVTFRWIVRYYCSNWIFSTTCVYNLSEWYLFLFSIYILIVLAMVFFNDVSCRVFERFHNILLNPYLYSCTPII